MHTTLSLLLRIAMAIPGVCVVCVFDSLTKEESFGPVLYFSTMAAIVIISYLGQVVISSLTGSPNKSTKPAASTSTMVNQALNQSTLSMLLVTGAVVIWLFLIGH